MKEIPMRDSSQLGYAFLFFLFFIGIGVIILSYGDIGIMFIGLVLILIGLSPLFYFIYTSWNETNEKESDNL